jgi:hypothetical protein
MLCRLWNRLVACAAFLVALCLLGDADHLGTAAKAAFLAAFGVGFFGWMFGALFLPRR